MTKNQNSLFIIGLVGVAAYFIYKSMKSNATNIDTSTGQPLSQSLATGQPAAAIQTIYQDGQKVDFSYPIKNDIATGYVDFTSGNVGKALTGGGTNSGYSLSFTPKTYTTMSSGFASGTGATDTYKQALSLLGNPFDKKLVRA